jgi:hypothetical protein
MSSKSRSEMQVGFLASTGHGPSLWPSLSTLWPHIAEEPLSASPALWTSLVLLFKTVEVFLGRRGTKERG